MIRPSVDPTAVAARDRYRDWLLSLTYHAPRKRWTRAYGTGKSTAVSVRAETFDRVKQAAKARGVTMRTLMDQILAETLRGVE